MKKVETTLLATSDSLTFHFFQNKVKSWVHEWVYGEKKRKRSAKTINLFFLLAVFKHSLFFAFKKVNQLKEMTAETKQESNATKMLKMPYTANLEDLPIVSTDVKNLHFFQNPVANVRRGIYHNLKHFNILLTFSKLQSSDLYSVLFSASSIPARSDRWQSSSTKHLSSELVTSFKASWTGRWRPFLPLASFLSPLLLGTGLLLCDLTVTVMRSWRGQHETLRCWREKERNEKQTQYKIIVSASILQDEETQRWHYYAFHFSLARRQRKLYSVYLEYLEARDLN